MIPALALALLAAPSALPFAPPVDHPLTYRQTEHSVAEDGTDVTVTVTEQVVFARDGAGYVATIRALGADAKAPPAVAASVDAALRPFVGIPIRLHVSASGVPGAPIDVDATWAKIVAAMQTAADAAPADRRDALQQAARGLAALSTPQREATLLAPAVALLGLAAPDLAVGADAPLAEPVQTPFGAPLAARGTIRRAPDADGVRTYVRDLATSADDAAHLADALRADAAAGAASTDAARRTQIDQQIADVAALRIHETGRLSFSTTTGLLTASTKRTAAIDPSVPGGERPIAEDELLLIP